MEGDHGRDGHGHGQEAGEKRARERKCVNADMSMGQMGSVNTDISTGHMHSVNMDISMKAQTEPWPWPWMRTCP